MDLSKKDLGSQSSLVSDVQSVEEKAEAEDKAEVITAINHLINSCVSAQKAGVYTLQEAAAIVDASKILQVKFGKPT